MGLDVGILKILGETEDETLRKMVMSSVITFMNV